MELPNKILLSVISLSVVVVIVATGYKFLWLNDYNFIIEAECDPSFESCFHRDCGMLDECPPNNFENYKVFRVSAADFSRCSDNSCANECKGGAISCEEVVCGDTEIDVCSFSKSPAVIETAGITIGGNVLGAQVFEAQR